LLRNVSLSSCRKSWTSIRHWLRETWRGWVESLMIRNNFLRIVANVVLLSIRIGKFLSIAVFSQNHFPLFRGIQNSPCFLTNLIEFVIRFSLFALPIICIFPDDCVMANPVLCVLKFDFGHLSFENQGKILEFNYV